VLRLLRRSAWPAGRRRQACPWPRKSESVAGALAPGETRRSLSALRLVIVRLAAGALRRRLLMLRTPRQQPCFHVFVFDVVAGLHLAFHLTDFSQHPLLIGDVRLDRIGDEKVGTSSRQPGQLGQPLLGVCLQTDAEGCAWCVRHEHILARGLPESPYAFARLDAILRVDFIPPASVLLFRRVQRLDFARFLVPVLLPLRQICEASSLEPARRILAKLPQTASDVVPYIPNPNQKSFAHTSP
jgi:hypothetical protein